MIPDNVFDDLIKHGNLGDELTASLKLTRKLSRKMRKEMKKFTDQNPSVCERFTYDNEHKESDNLPGKLILEEGDSLSNDPQVNEAHIHHGIVRRFLQEILGRDSFDGVGGDLHGSVHYGEGFDNAFFGNVSGKGYQMVYGDGLMFKPLTASLDVAAHEIGHGVTQYTAKLKYLYSPGALNESLSDVYGICCKHWHRNTPIKDANWLIGDEIVTEKFPGKAIRTFLDEPAYKGDSQPKNQKNYKYLMPWQDNGGVHINSGIPNHAFYLFCLNCAELDENARSWEAPLDIWYHAAIQLKSLSGFKDMKNATLAYAKVKHPTLVSALEDAWNKVGL